MTDDTWTPWAGGECPVPAGTRILLRFRIDPPQHPGDETAEPESHRWSRTGGLGDIVAYRVLASAPKVEPIDDPDEAYQLGLRDGREQTLQLIDLRTGGDGEYVGSTIPGRTVDDKVMEDRIVARHGALEAALAAAEAREKDRLRARPLAEWHEDFGPALWWSFPIEEPPFVGDPRGSDWPGYHTHWTPLRNEDCPVDPDAALREPEGGERG